MRRRGTAVAALLILASLVFAGVALAQRAPGRPPSLDQRVTDVAAGLRCPSCQGESVADSQSEVAKGMRAQIRSQLRSGRSPDQIRSWFASRYGDSVLMTPSGHGIDALLWVLPAGLFLAGLAGIALMVRRRRRPAAARVEPAGEPESQPEPEPETEPAGDHGKHDRPARRRDTDPVIRIATVTAVVLVVLAVAVPGLWRSSGTPASSAASGAPRAEPTPAASTSMNAQSWLQLGLVLENKGSYEDASRAYRNSLQLDPGDKQVQLRLAFALLRADHPKQALPVARAAAEHNHTPNAVLILGLAQRANGQPGATRTLREFLRMAPDHPAAPQVRRLLKGSR